MIPLVMLFKVGLALLFICLVTMACLIFKE